MMSENGNDEKSFKVEDRRTSSGKRDEPDGVSEPGKKEEAKQQDTGGGSKSRSSVKGSESSAPEVDFSTFIFSLFTSALIQMGDMADPVTGNIEKNIQAAKQTIDILDILARKTEGNLSDEEANLLKNASAELKWKYIDAVKGKG